MKLLAKLSCTAILTLIFFNISYAQKKRIAPYNAVVMAEKRFHGKIIAINEIELVLVDRKNVVQNISFQKISRIKVYKAHKDVGYAIVTGALAAGTIVAAQAIDDANVAMLVGVGGTAAVVGLSMVLHNVIHGAEVKMKSTKEKIDFDNVSKKLTPYIVNDAALKL